MTDSLMDKNLIRFGQFEADLRTGELRKRGSRLRMQDQPFQVLAILLAKPGELVTREELQQKLWQQDTFVDFDHGLNTAINKIREALGDSANEPQYVETLPKRGYRFIAPVETAATISTTSSEEITAVSPDLQKDINSLPPANRNAARFMFALIQVMYLIFYVVALIQHEKNADFLEAHSPASAKFLLGLIFLTAILGIATRLYLFNAVAFDYHGLGVKFLRLFPALAVQDILWALSPFLAIPVIGTGAAFASVAALLWTPFAQRTLIKMAYQY